MKDSFDAMSTSRRELLRSCLRAAGAAAVLLPALGGCRSSVLLPEPGSFSATFDVTTLTTDGAWLMTPTDGTDGAPILIVRIEDGMYEAISTLCTHMGCPLRSPVGGIITCTCHESTFDLHGNVLHDPATRPLKRYRVTYDRARGMVTVTE